MNLPIAEDVPPLCTPQHIWQRENLINWIRAWAGLPHFFLIRTQAGWELCTQETWAYKGFGRSRREVVVSLVVKLCFCLKVVWVLRGAWELSLPVVTQFLSPWGSCRRGKGVCLCAGFRRSPRESVGLEQRRAGSSWASELSPVMVGSTRRVCCSSPISLQLSGTFHLWKEPPWNDSAPLALWDRKAGVATVGSQEVATKAELFWNKCLGMLWPLASLMHCFVFGFFFFFFFREHIKRAVCT